MICLKRILKKDRHTGAISGCTGMPERRMFAVKKNRGTKQLIAGQEKGRRILQMLFFPEIILYSELLLRAFDRESQFFTMALLRIGFFSAAAGLLVYLLLDLIPWPKLSRTLGGIVIFVNTVYICTQYCCKSFFGNYFAVGYMGQMAEGVVGDFSGTMFDVIGKALPFILLSLIPIVLYLLIRTRFFHKQLDAGKRRLAALILFVVFQLLGSVISVTGSSRNLYTYDFQTNIAIGEFGAFTALRLEVQYAVFGAPEAPLDQIIIPTEDPTEATSNGASDATQDTGTDPTDGAQKPPEIVYDHNQLPINFEKLKENASGDTLKAMHTYFGSLTPSQQNEYTGYFAGKNLILITAEAFCPYVISQELTPTLYKLANESFIFTNYYQPDWYQSTAGGEFAVMTGLIPTWQGNTVALKASASVSMPFTLGWAFRELGYSSLAYHNNSYTYYDRHKSHPNFGYDYTAIGNGLVLETKNWPNSDLEMMKATVSGYIQDYVQTGKNFHTYYMTVSGHANYNWPGNNMAQRNKEAAQAAYPNSSDAVQAYIACNLELEYAMAYLMEQLETAGIADETVIALTTDHYPYGLVENGKDYYVELSGIADTVNDVSRYKNSLILWCGSMEEPVVVDTPCSSIDVVPTLCNLFGIDYDSRLFSGRDVFAQNYTPNKASTSMPLVVFPMGKSYSWITDAGVYDAYKGIFTPNEGVEVNGDYVNTVSQLASAKFAYAKQVLQQDYYGIIAKELG